uniref:Uncharacterized protein LOC114328752 isoform X5 n=1 Tax=Diabrotica virgifera virgifera TaxID=50390 RepID=A0A6P7FK12_DIAVI
MKFVVFCIVLSTIVSLALTLDCEPNSRIVCADCSPEPHCQPKHAHKRACQICLCKCNKGFLRDGGRCVLPKDCPKK